MWKRDFVTRETFVFSATRFPHESFMVAVRQFILSSWVFLGQTFSCVHQNNSRFSLLLCFEEQEVCLQHVLSNFGRYFRLVEWCFYGAESSCRTLILRLFIVTVTAPQTKRDWGNKIKVLVLFLTTLHCFSVEISQSHANATVIMRNENMTPVKSGVPRKELLKFEIFYGVLSLLTVIHFHGFYKHPSVCLLTT